MTRASWPRIHLLMVALATLAILAPGALAQSPSSSLSGVVEGRVTDGATGEALPGARLAIPGTAIETSTDRQGMFRLTGVPAGQQTILVSYLGRRDETVDVDVTAGSARRLDVNLGANKFEESVTVQAELIRDAQARALNQQKTAPNITNVVSADQIGSFPDANAAETVQRIPGISITKDQGEGRYVNIRGTDARLNSMMINGERIPAPDPLLRQVALDVVPSELLQAIEVSKALTPDMDADAIGGSVNLVMKTAPEKFRAAGCARRRLQPDVVQLRTERLHVDRRPAIRCGQVRRDRLGDRLGNSPRQSGHGGRLHQCARPERAEPPVLPGQSSPHRGDRRDRLQADGQHVLHRSRGVQSLHRRPREPPARALAGRQQPHRSRAARSHAHRADRLAGHHRAARSAQGSATRRLRAPRRLLRSVRSADDDDDVSANRG